MCVSGVAEQFAIAEAKLRAWSSVDGDDSNDDSYDEDFIPANEPTTQSTGTVHTHTHTILIRPPPKLLKILTRHFSTSQFEPMLPNYNWSITEECKVLLSHIFIYSYLAFYPPGPAHPFPPSPHLSLSPLSLSVW